MSEEQGGHDLDKATIQPKRKIIDKNFLKYLLAFVAGAAVSFAITYIVVFQPFTVPGVKTATETSAPRSSQSAVPNATSPAPKETPSPTAKSQVSEKEVKEFTETVDCSKAGKYTNLTIDANRVVMKSIDLDRAQINIQFFESTTLRPMSFLSLPEVVDYKCDTIKLSDLKSGQTIRLYDYNAAATRTEPEKRGYIFLIQKITR